MRVRMALQLSHRIDLQTHRKASGPTPSKGALAMTAIKKIISTTAAAMLVTGSMSVLAQQTPAPQAAGQSNSGYTQQATTPPGSAATNAAGTTGVRPSNSTPAGGSGAGMAGSGTTMNQPNQVAPVPSAGTTPTPATGTTGMTHTPRDKNDTRGMSNSGRTMQKP